MKVRRVCQECCELGLRTFPLKPLLRATCVGLLRFAAVLKEDKSPDQKCDQCGEVKPGVFSYPVADETVDLECARCEHPPYHPIHTTSPAGHPFQQKEIKAS